MREELEAPCQQRRGVECVRLVVLAQHAPLADAVCEDLLSDLVRSCAPCRRSLWVASHLRQLARAVQGDTAHQFGGHVVLRLAAGLPDALVGVAPDTGRTRRLRLDDRPEPARQTLVAAGVEQDRIEDSAKDVVLVLTEGGIADSNRARTCVAREVVPC